MVLVFEGHDGVGKTTLIHHLEQYFLSKKIKAVIVKNPSPIFDLHHPNDDLQSSYYKSFSASVYTLYEIQKLKERYDYILVDRYFYSTYVSFKARGLKVDIKDFDLFQKPDKAFLIHLPEALRQSRLLKREESHIHDTQTFNSDLISKADLYYQSFEMIQIINDGTVEKMVSEIIKTL